MSEAAFKATFSDLKLLKGRKVAQVILEIPIEAADHALTVLGGVPRPDAERWVAVARLDPEATQRAPEGALTRAEWNERSIQHGLAEENEFRLKDGEGRVYRVPFGDVGDVRDDSLMGSPSKAAGSVAVQAAEKPRKKWAELSRAQRAGIACNDPAFWNFLENRYHKAWILGDKVGGEPAGNAAAAVRMICDVESRSHLDGNVLHEKRWDALYKVRPQACQRWHAEGGGLPDASPMDQAAAVRDAR